MRILVILCAIIGCSISAPAEGRVFSKCNLSLAEIPAIDKLMQYVENSTLQLHVIIT